MAETLWGRLTSGWNAFVGRQEIEKQEDDLFRQGYSPSVSYGHARQDRIQTPYVNHKTIISSIYTTLSVDVAEIEIRHVRLDAEGRYVSDIDSYLNECLMIAPNIDQEARAFRQDLALSLFNKGVIAIVPVETTLSPLQTGGYDIKQFRVGEVVQWFPEKVRVLLYNQLSGNKEEIDLPKSMVAIVENPFYSVMNEPNSTLQRLNAKLHQLDAVDEQASSGKLDLIIQLPYVVKTEARRQQAEQRRKDIELQLKGSQYGIAYTDGTERITQLNRPVENNLLSQITDLRQQLYNQLGLTEEVIKGTADEATMINYHNRTIKPIVQAIQESMHRTFLTKTARTQRQAIRFFKNPFMLVPVSQLAEIGDKLTRNEILTSNEMRAIMGMRPSADPNADKLRNSNMPQQESDDPAVQKGYAYQVEPPQIDAGVPE